MVGVAVFANVFSSPRGGAAKIRERKKHFDVSHASVSGIRTRRRVGDLIAQTRRVRHHSCRHVFCPHRRPPKKGEGEFRESARSRQPQHTNFACNCRVRVFAAFTNVLVWSTGFYPLHSARRLTVALQANRMNEWRKHFLPWGQRIGFQQRIGANQGGPSHFHTLQPE